MKNFLLPILVLFSCARHKPQDTAETTAVERLEAKRDLIAELATSQRDSHGWIATHECDALHHSALGAVGGPVHYQVLFAAREESGRWNRDPEKTCFPGSPERLANGTASKARISRDQLLALLLAMAVHRDLEGVSALVAYGEQHDWVFGDHDGSLEGMNRVRATPGFKSLMYEVRHALGGPYNDAQAIPQVYFPHDGFEAHLQALTILIRGIIHGQITQIELNTIKSQTEKDPNNALFWAIRAKFDPEIRGNQDKAASILLEEKYFPADRLPTSADRCINYLWMHGEKASDWGPCQPLVTHPAHDFLLVAWVIFDNSAGFKFWLSDNVH